MNRAAILVVPIVLALVTPILGCRTTDQETVRQFGEMRAVMREGDTKPRVALREAADWPGAVAVGALAGLAGEITIYEGQVWVAHPDGNSLTVTGPEPMPGDQATLLTLASVESWIELPLGLSDVTGGSELEARIQRAGAEQGIDTTKPFPFAIRDSGAFVDMHVINGYCPTATDPATMDAQPWRWTSPEPTSLTAVGFFAPNAAGIMTHHGSSIHVHAIVEQHSGTITGHIDRLAVSPSAVIRLPAPR